jgi:hypothetical protein
MSNLIIIKRFEKFYYDKEDKEIRTQYKILNVSKTMLIDELYCKLIKYIKNYNMNIYTEIKLNLPLLCEKYSNKIKQLCVEIINLNIDDIYERQVNKTIDYCLGNILNQSITNCDMIFLYILYCLKFQDYNKVIELSDYIYQYQYQYKNIDDKEKQIQEKKLQQHILYMSIFDDDDVEVNFCDRCVSNEEGLVFLDEQDDYKYIVINTTEIFFTQKSIKYNFRDGKNVYDTIRQLRKGIIGIKDIPYILVIHNPYNNKYYSINNRRLFCFKKAFIKEIIVISIDWDKLKLRTKNKCTGNIKSVKVR